MGWPRSLFGLFCKMRQNKLRMNFLGSPLSKIGAHGGNKTGKRKETIKMHLSSSRLPWGLIKAGPPRKLWNAA